MLHAALEAAAARFGDRPALLAGESTWSFYDIDTRANSLAHALAAQGVTAGGRVALMCTNRPEFVVAVNAVSKLGAAVVMLSPAWKEREVDHALSLTLPTHAVADGPAALLLDSRLTVTDLDAFDLSPTPPQEPLTRPPTSESDEAVLVFSSGTTGLPKAVRHTHDSIGHGTTSWVQALALTSDDRFQITTPPSHILGLLNLLAATEAGATVRLHKRFDVDAFLQSVQTDKTTLEMAVAPIAIAIANHPQLEQFDLSTLRFMLWGATPVTESVALTVTARTGVPWLVGYGASELPVISCNPIHNPDAWRLESVGRAAPGVELRVCDLDSAETLDANSVGEIEARAPSLMAGYLPAEANQEAFHEGWYRTGDVGWISEDGWLHLTDRSKEMIKVSGFQVAPAEIEAVLHSHPAVRDCAVFGVPDPTAGEVPIAAVATDPTLDVHHAELMALVADSLATYKHVRAVFVVDAIPRLPSGKVLRRELKAKWLAQRGEP